jgi:hypothetical protein
MIDLSVFVTPFYCWCPDRQFLPPPALICEAQMFGYFWESQAHIVVTPGILADRDSLFFRVWKSTEIPFFLRFFYQSTRLGLQLGLGIVILGH